MRDSVTLAINNLVDESIPISPLIPFPYLAALGDICGLEPGQLRLSVLLESCLRMHLYTWLLS